MGRCCGLSKSWRYYYSISSATSIREGAVPEDQVFYEYMESLAVS